MLYLCDVEILKIKIMKTLISMTDYVLRETNSPTTLAESFQRCVTYAKFLSLTPEIWQFVPCKLVDGVWVVFEEPDHYLLWLIGIAPDDSQAEICQEYQTAKERCYFEGFEFVKKYSYGFKLRVAFDDYEEFITILNEETIEDLLTYSVNFDWTLTATAQKEILKTLEK